MQHREVVVALANAHRDGFTGVPFLLFGTLVGFSFPLRGGQQAAHFTKNINAGQLAKSKALHLVMNGVHPHVVGQDVVVGVAGLDNGFVHVHQAMPPLFVVTKAVVAKHEIARIDDRLLGGSSPGLQRRQCHEGLVGRARGVSAAQSPVEQGFVGRFIECLPTLAVDALHKQVGIERGFTHKGQNFSGFGVDRHQGAAPGAKELFHQMLQLDVNGQSNRVSGRGGAAGQTAHSPSTGRGLYGIDTRQAMQLRLEALLNSQFSDVVRAPVVGLIFGFIQALFLRRVDAPNVANDMAG